MQADAHACPVETPLLVAGCSNADTVDNCCVSDLKRPLVAVWWARRLLMVMLKKGQVPTQSYTESFCGTDFTEGRMT
eukprot:1158088-Pelagomonas_calceolata.AAC.3